MRIFERGFIGDSLRIEENKIRNETRPHNAAVVKRKSTRRQRSHAANGIFECQHLPFSDKIAEHPGIGSVRPRMWLASPVRHDGAIAGHRGIRITKDGIHIFQAHVVVNHRCAVNTTGLATFDHHVEDRLDFGVCGARSFNEPVNLADRAADIRWFRPVLCHGRK